MEKSLKNIKKQFAKKGIFYTPKEDAERLKKYINIDYTEVYDPTCGQGNLLSVFPDHIRKYGQELDELELEKAKQTLVNFEGYAGDTLSCDMFKDRKFDLIMANPPFSIEWEQLPNDERFNKCALAPKSKSDWAFNLHIVHHLKENGQAIVLNFPGTAYRSNAEQKIRKWFIDNNLIERIAMYPPNTFVDTKISTVLYIFKKCKNTTNVIFQDENGNEKIITQKEIIDNDYNLSVNQYIAQTYEKEEVDIHKLNTGLRCSLIKETIKKLEWDKIVCDMENYNDHLEFVEKLIQAIAVYKRNVIKVK